ncbi:hypothetical protein TGDOM2_203820 [Toxoplasma gondii GAB2-2007-GAL-DOM2]|uniref:Uncharacterized protein n=4 Tax=Toxoplasma gondii TaxID=5811 RepID=S7W3A4_TOXGG|nr:hypothetical protein TGGT1_203820 [Toxoplasma gondii GT1]KAF4642794.1 hypothetical protein TGRH88_035200 [Toxoplasma gondii]KFG37937.1 hypothetical protein TGDOM2_203820 [Toxoplasma gondii GAB2-2007-GAL-DOM2]KFG39444.1 hypothetical protein TGFOU_203820 [Toxoplasma gondii FOU]
MESEIAFENACPEAAVESFSHNLQKDSTAFEATRAPPVTPNDNNPSVGVTLGNGVQHFPCSAGLATESDIPWAANGALLSAEAVASAAATAEVYEAKMQEMKTQIVDLWSQKEAFRRANERITRLLMRLQQRGPSAAADLNAKAAEALRSTRGSSTHRGSRTNLDTPQEERSSQTTRSSRTEGRCSGSPHRNESIAERSLHPSFMGSSSQKQSAQDECGTVLKTPSLVVPPLKLGGMVLQKKEGALTDRTKSEPGSTEGCRNGTTVSARHLHGGGNIGKQPDGREHIASVIRRNGEKELGRFNGTASKHQQGTQESACKQTYLPPLPLRSVRTSTSHKGGNTSSRRRSMSQNVRIPAVPAGTCDRPALGSQLGRSSTTSYPAVPPLPINQRRTLQLSQSLASARSRSRRGAFTSRPSLAETALRTPRRCFLDDGISCAVQSLSKDCAGTSAGPSGSVSSVLCTDAEPVLNMHSSNASAGLAAHDTGFADLEEHVAASVRQALETLQTADGGMRSHSGASSSAAAAAVAATGMTGGMMSCVQKPTDGYWHIMYTCVLKIRGTDFFLDVRCGDKGPKSGRLIASTERAGVFKVCVRHLLKSARDFYDSLKVLWWQPMPVVVADGLLPFDELLRRHAEKEMEKRRKRNKKKNRRRRGKGNDAQSSVDKGTTVLRTPEAHTSCGPDVDLLKSSSAGTSFSLSRGPGDNITNNAGQGDPDEPAEVEANAAATRKVMGSVLLSGHSPSLDDRSDVSSGGGDAGSATQESKRKADYSEWDVVALMYIGSLDAETPVAQFQGLQTRDGGSSSPKNTDDCWYVSNSKAAFPVCRGCGSTTGTSERARGDTSGQNLKEATSTRSGGQATNRITSSCECEKGGRSSGRTPPSSDAPHEASLERAFDRACQLCLHNRLTPHEAFIVKRADRERGCFPLYHKTGRRYLYAHPTNGLVGMITASSTVVAATAQKIMAGIKSKKVDGRSAVSRETEEQDSVLHPLLGDEKNNTQEGDDISGRQVFMPSEFELIALSDLMVQQTVAQILASLPSVESPRGSWDHSGLWGKEGIDESEDEEGEIDHLKNRSRATTVSSDETDCQQGGSATSFPCSGDEDNGDGLSCDASNARHDSLSLESFFGDHMHRTSEQFLPAAEAFSSSTVRGTVSSEDDKGSRQHGAKGLRIRMVPLSGDRNKCRRESLPRRSHEHSVTHKRRPSRKSRSHREPLDNPENAVERFTTGVCDQFVFSDLDAETDLEEETEFFGVSLDGGVSDETTIGGKYT